jgi:uncharacterized protein with HEPN domain
LANLLPLLANANKLILGESNAAIRKALRARFAKVPLANRVFGKPSPFKENACKLILGESNAAIRKALRARFAKVPLANRKIIE